MDSAAELTQQALALHQKGDFDEAGSLYEDALRLDPQCFEARDMIRRRI